MKGRKTSSKASSLAQAAAMLGLAVGAVVPMSGCSAPEDAGKPAADQAGASQTDAAGSTEQSSAGAENPCAVKKKKKGPCAVGG